MQLTYKGQAFFMAWCLECHRRPENYVTKPGSDFVFNLYRKYQTHAEMTAEERTLAEGHQYQRSPDELEKGRQWLEKYKVQTKQLSDCWTCHR
jgi:hypothetical protein